MALRFTGDGTYAQKSIAFTAGKGTVALWFNLLVDRNDYSTIVQLNNEDNGQVVVRTAADGVTLNCYTYDGSVTGTTLLTSTWYHLAVSWDGNDTLVYLDGVLDITNGNNGADWSEVRLGASYWGDPLNGAIARIVAWNDVLSQAQIQNQIPSVFPVTYTNIVGFWPTLADEQLTDSNGVLLEDSDGNPLYNNQTNLNDKSGAENHFSRFGPGELADYPNPYLDVDTPDCRLVTIQFEARASVVESEDRNMRVAAETRSMQVAAEVRSMAVPAVERAVALEC